MSRKQKKAHNRSASRKFCDPGVCDCCQYIGEGDFLCDKHMEIVVSDWTPTESYLMSGPAQHDWRWQTIIGPKKRLHINRVSPEQLSSVIDYRTPLGLFLTKEHRTWVAVDNTTGDAWTEEFSRKRQAVRWLRGKFEVCG